MADRFNVLDDYDNIITLSGKTATVDFAGTTVPALVGPYAAFDAATDEVGYYATTVAGWTTADVYIETYNAAGGSGNSVWTIDVNGAGQQAPVTITAGTQYAAVVTLVGTVSSFLSADVAGIARKAVGIALRRDANVAGDTLAVDEYVGAVHLVRTS